jgi:hypothetical protein
MGCSCWTFREEPPTRPHVPKPSPRLRIITENAPKAGSETPQLSPFGRGFLCLAMALLQHSTFFVRIKGCARPRGPAWASDIHAAVTWPLNALEPFRDERILQTPNWSPPGPTSVRSGGPFSVCVCVREDTIMTAA